MAIPLAAIGLGMQAASLASSVFGKKKKAKGPDIGYLTGQIKEGSEKARGLAGQEFQALQPLSGQYGTQMEQLGAGYEQKAKGLAEEYQKGLGQLGEADKTARDLSVALKTKEEMGSVPLQQQMLREQLAASGGLRTGAAGKILAQPTQQAAERVGQFGSQLDVENLARQSARQEQGVSALYQSQAGAALTKLGLDQTKLQTLLDAGRTDIISKYAKLAGIDEAELNAMLGLHGMAAQTEMANVAASNAQKQSVLDALSGFGGSLVGYAASQPTANKTAMTTHFGKVNYR